MVNRGSARDELIEQLTREMGLSQEEVTRFLEAVVRAFSALHEAGDTVRLIDAKQGADFELPTTRDELNLLVLQ